MRNKDEQKELLIREQAILMIVREGFDGLSMQKLAREAGISASTIYIYFDNREDLLNKLYAQVQAAFVTESLRDFDPAMSLADGLWLQWQNRYRHIQQNPVHFRFSEQFRTSPLIRKDMANDGAFREVLNRFVKNAVQQKQLIDLPAELFWALAYGPFYTLVRFHLDQSSMAGKPFSLNKRILRSAFELVLKALTPAQADPSYDPNLESLL